MKEKLRCIGVVLIAAMTLSAGSAAQAKGESESGEIGFERILAAPGDVELNERYAREQIQRGDLRGAGTTLERVMLLAPQRDSTRLLYAAVLYRLGDIADAERELRAVLSRPVSAEMKAEAEKYMRLVASGKRQTHFDARLSLGSSYDDNRNTAPDSGTRLFLAQPITLNGDSTRREDTNIQLAASLGVARDIGGARRHSLFARVGYFRGEQTLVDILDLQAYTAKAGGVIHTRWVDIAPTAGFDHVLLSQSTYLRSFSTGLSLTRRISRRCELAAEFERADQGFIRAPAVTAGADRRGDQYTFGVTGRFLATPLDRFSASLGHRRKFARADYLAYRRESIGVDYTRLLSRGMFASAGATVDLDRYERADKSVSERVRQDNAATFSLLYGMPMNIVSKRLDGFTGTLGYERFQQSSNLTNFTYSNNRLTAMMIYSWGI
ncbi:MAG: tetratricopeptide repeat protein [Elusimicrobiota bacterium]